MLSDIERQERREQLMRKHRKKRGGFVYNNSGRLRTLCDLYRIDPALDLFLFKPKERKVK
jgi:hypothetical protein